MLRFEGVQQQGHELVEVGAQFERRHRELVGVQQDVDLTPGVFGRRGIRGVVRTIGVASRDDKSFLVPFDRPDGGTCAWWTVEKEHSLSAFDPIPR